jgi:dTDP-4-amino-4,6-dideoxygalactose transaminase
MIFETEKLDKLFKMVEQRYENKKFYEIFLEKVEKKFHTNGSGASEYEIYFNYLLTYHRNEITIRKLNWKNAKALDHKVDYVSIHWHLGFSNLDERQKMIDDSEKKRQNVVRLL